jgi:uroporphyrinogen decarboxylase
LSVVSSPFRFIKALQRQAVDRPPVWIMRQAGRYMPEYRALRANVTNFMDFCRNPQLCAQAAMLPIEHYNLDAAIVFSDILVLPDAMGLDLSFVQHEGPVISNPVRTMHDVVRLDANTNNIDLAYVCEALALTKAQLQNTTPILGFIGSPWTLAAYMVEGSSSKQFSYLRRMMYTNPQTLHALLDLLSQQLIKFVGQQISAGADAIQIFDSWAGLLAKDAYSEFSVAYMRKIVLAIKSKHPHIPIIVFAKNNGMWVRELIATGCDALSLDWQADIASIKQSVGAQVALQGNLDPCVLYADKEVIQAKTLALLELFKGHPGFIFNLGHGIYPDVPPQHVHHMLETIKSYQN